MTISDEQVTAMAVALQERGLPDEQIRALHPAIDSVYNDIRAVCERCRSVDIPESVRQPLFETTKDVGGLRDAFREARLEQTGDRHW
jgi:hypothetical protein